VKIPFKVGYLMSEQKAAAVKLSEEFIKEFIKGSLLLVLLWCVLSGKSFGQGKPDLTKPFKKCWSYGAGNGLSRIAASDNESRIILTNDEFKLVSIDLRTKRENWITEAGGYLGDYAASDSNNLFFLTSFVDRNKSKIFTLNSISLQTGITVWQRRLTDYSSVRLYSSQDKTRIFLISGDKLLLLVNKIDGSIQWKKEFADPVISLESVSENDLNILTGSRLYRVSAQDGAVLSEWKFNGKPFIKAILKNDYVFWGYPTGEVAKSDAGNRREILWKVKTGGSISELYELNDGVLVASLDNFLYLFSKVNGDIRWKRRVSGRINIKPLIYGNFAIVLSSADNLAIIIDLSDGKVVNQISVEDDNYFLGQPLIVGNQLVLQTYRGVYFFVNSNLSCP
jgi:outer membrane protein assembly factor BamB